MSSILYIAIPIRFEKQKYKPSQSLREFTYISFIEFSRIVYELKEDKETFIFIKAPLDKY